MSGSNRFFTILIVPEKTSQVRRILVPSWLVKGAALGIALFTLVAIVMIADYWYVINQIGENKQLKMENRRLRQQVQVFKNKVTTIESTMERVKTFATRLKVITNIEDRGSLLQSINNEKIPEANLSLPVTPTAPASSSPPGQAQGGPVNTGSHITTSSFNSQEQSEAAAFANSGDPEDASLRKEYEDLDEKFSELNRDTLYVEQMLQDQYELLADQKSFLAALPTRKPAVGYFTSGFGVRRSPWGKIKMHEGLDIANHPGTHIQAPADGTVAFADTKAGYGQILILDHGYGLETWYGHARKLLVTKGQKVRRGDTIALLGNSGRSTGPHLHYEVRVHGTPVDPLSYILEN